MCSTFFSTCSRTYIFYGMCTVTTYIIAIVNGTRMLLECITITITIFCSFVQGFDLWVLRGRGWGLRRMAYSVYLLTVGTCNEEQKFHVTYSLDSLCHPMHI